MNDGRLLALDTPGALKDTALSGLAWDVFAEPLISALASLERCPCVQRAGLAGDHLRAITPPDATAPSLASCLEGDGIRVLRLEQVEPTLEDVFLALTG